jgi:hypothetical protein
VMQHDRTPVAPRRPASKSCSACGQIKPASEFYVSRGRLSSYCKRCQRRISNDATDVAVRTPASVSGCAGSTALASALSEHAERRPTSRRSPTVPDEGFSRAGHTRPGPRIHDARYGPSPGGVRSGDGSSRRPRWDRDAGITERDAAALLWLGQQYAARSDVLRVLLGRLSPGSPKVTGQLSEQTLRQILCRWEDRGLIARDRLLGFQWVAPTAKALRLVGLEVRGWSFVIPQLAHVHAVGVVRLALEPSMPAGGRWLSERELRREAGKSHVPDAAVRLPDEPDLTAGSGLFGEDVDPLPKRIAVEVELTPPAA